MTLDTSTQITDQLSGLRAQMDSLGHDLLAVQEKLATLDQDVKARLDVVQTSTAEGVQGIDTAVRQMRSDMAVAHANQHGLLTDFGALLTSYSATVQQISQETWKSLDALRAQMERLPRTEAVQDIAAAVQQVRQQVSGLQSNQIILLEKLEILASSYSLAIQRAGGDTSNPLDRPNGVNNQPLLQEDVKGIATAVQQLSRELAVVQSKQDALLAVPRDHASTGASTPPPSDNGLTNWDGSQQLAPTGLASANQVVVVDRAEIGVQAWLALARDSKVVVDARVHAAESLGDHGWLDAAALAWSSLAHDKTADAQVHLQAIETLGEMGRAEDLLALARDEEVTAEVRERCAEALGELGQTDDASTLLLAMARNPDLSASVRLAAIKELVRFANASVQSALQSLVQVDKDTAIRNAAQQTIKRLRERR